MLWLIKQESKPISNIERVNDSIEQLKIREILQIMINKIDEATPAINPTSLALNQTRSLLSILNGHFTGAGQPSINYGHPVSHRNSFAQLSFLREPSFALL